MHKIFLSIRRGNDNLTFWNLPVYLCQIVRNIISKNDCLPVRHFDDSTFCYFDISIFQHLKSSTFRRSDNSTLRHLNPFLCGSRSCGGHGIIVFPSTFHQTNKLANHLDGHTLFLTHTHSLHTHKHSLHTHKHTLWHRYTHTLTDTTLFLTHTN